MIDDVAYFGISKWGSRRERDDVNKASEVRPARCGWRSAACCPSARSVDADGCALRQVAAFDLVAGVLLWRRDVATKGLLNVVGAPHISETAPSLAQRGWSTTPRRRMISDGERLVAVLDPMPYVPYDPSSGAKPRQIALADKKAAAKLPQRRLPPHMAGFGAYVPLRHVDVSALAARLAEHPEIWDAEVAAKDNAVLQGRESNMARFKPGCASAHFVFSDQNAEACFNFPWFADWHDVLQPILDEILSWYGVPVDQRAHRAVRLQLARMAPGGKILKHSDKGGWATGLHRIHIPIITNPDVQFLMMADAEGNFVPLHLAPGDVFEINNVIPHQARGKRMRASDVYAQRCSDAAAPPRCPSARRCTTAWSTSACTCCWTLARRLWSATHSSAARRAPIRTSSASSAERTQRVICMPNDVALMRRVWRSAAREAWGGACWFLQQNGLWFQPKPPPD